MSSPPSGPGKTAPKLYHDFLEFDPLKAVRGSNVLADYAPPSGEGPQIGSPIGSCKHDYTTKHDQSITPPYDLRPDGTTQYKLAVVCKKCRVHATVRISYARATKPCPNAEYPLHHFQRQAAEDRTTDTQITYGWQCSAPQCQAHLEVGFRQPRLLGKDRELLSNTELLKRRYEAVLAHDPSRDGIRQATPIDALTRLRRYINDALDPAHTRRTFPANNKRFIEAYGVHGEDCKELLERLGFKYAEAYTWTLPDPPPVDHRLQASGSSQRELLEDVDMELKAMMHKIASETGAMNPVAGEGWEAADRAVERTLAVQGYQRYSPLRRITISNEELPYFNSLGALPDFADSLIEFCYERQSNCDPERQSYYLECLQVIAQSRNSEQLRTKVVMLESQDLVSRRDLSSAYRALTLPAPRPGSSITDQFILSTFQSVQANVNADTAETNRQALYKIGVSRQSQPLISASRQSVETYEEALAWLGNDVTKDTPDDSLLAVAATRGDSAADKEIAKKAIATIARERKSNMLNSWVLTGSGDSYEMGVDEALRLLGINQPLQELDTGMLHLQFDQVRLDKPGKQTDEAIQVVQNAMSSGENYPSGNHSPESWPVGLVSHGNTCYLNSLLQYYFCIEPLRNIVLNYDQYEQASEKVQQVKMKEKKAQGEEPSEIRVGGTVLKPEEVKGGQRFAKDLKTLFERMIKASGSTVKPEADLVCRAFLKAEDYKLLPSSDMDDAGIVPDGLQTNGVETVAEEDANGHASDANGVIEKPRQPSNASSATLQGSPIGDEDARMIDGGKMPDTPPDSPPQKAQQDSAQSEQRPPLPPRHRRFSTNEEHAAAQKLALQKAEQQAKAQQDVSDVHETTMTRLRAGMKPDGVDFLGEQEDALRSLYTITTTETTVNEDGSTGKPELYMVPSIMLNIPKPVQATNIYAALDQIWDLRPSGTKKASSYTSITSWPAILQINIPRLDFVRGKGMTKLGYMMELEDTLYLDRYVDSCDPSVLPSRKRCWEWRARLRQLKEEEDKLKGEIVEGLDGPKALSATSAYLESLSGIDEELGEVDVEALDMDAEFSADLNAVAQLSTRRLAELTPEIESLQQKINGEFRDLNKIKYRLAAVFFHRGNTGGGHYWVCIHDFAKDMWRTYNDERVEEVPKAKLDDIFRANTWDHGTPTFVVYVQDQRKEELVQPVCRQPEKEPETEWADVGAGNDVQMSDTSGWQVPPDTVNPKMIEEGGESGWDAQRVVASANW